MSWEEKRLFFKNKAEPKAGKKGDRGGGDPYPGEDLGQQDAKSNNLRPLLYPT